MFRLFAKEKAVLTGYDFDSLIAQVEEVLSDFYWRSIERVLRTQVRPGVNSRSEKTADGKESKWLL